MAEEDNYHKGLWCWLKRIFCQEGWCQSCWLFKKWDELIDKTEEING
jgi:hypothetical protein